MSGLSVFEEMAEEFFEGKLGRLLGSRLQPVHIANLLARAVEDEKTVAPDGNSIAPNRFVVLVNPQDYQEMQPMLEALQERLSDYVHRFALSKRLTLIGCARVAIQPSPSVCASRARVRTSNETPGPAETRADHTRPIQFR